MRIPLERDSQIPLYEQIETFIRQNIQTGRLLPETRLPASRQMAADLGINRITAENAYAELEADGLVYRRMGSGTYVASPPKILAGAQKPSSTALPHWQQALNPFERVPTFRQISQLQAQKLCREDHINLASGSCDAHLFPADEFRKVIQSVIHRDGTAAFEYGDYAGYLPLRETIAQILTSDGIPARAENVLVTSGSQQALALTVQLLLKPGDTILTEETSYSSALDLFHSLDLKVVGVPMDTKGMQVDKVEAVLQSVQPRLIYTIPNFHNPTGMCLSGQRRRQLIALADHYDVPILEDDFVGDLRYDGKAQPALKALDPGGRVIYMGTFSKMLMPGLRIGYVVAEGPVYEQLIMIKHIHDLATSSFIQRALQAYITVGRYQAHLRRACQAYRRRRSAMTNAIQRNMPPSVHFDPPQGGIFLWLRLPEWLSADEVYPYAYEEGVSFVPGSLFTTNGTSHNCMRLNFTMHSPEVNEEGIKRLSKAVQRLVKTG